MDMPENDDLTYGVGYGKPPTRTRFRHGVSGNPKGRPKGRLNFATVLERTLQEKVVIEEDGVRKAVTKLEAAVKQLVSKATSGDMVAIRQLAALTASLGIETERVQAKAPLSDADLKLVNGIVSRFQQFKGQ
jgi:hypothetical protein